MSITTNAERIRVESPAKNGTLGTQGAINANQIKFDTNISTNNGNLMASPTFKRRHVVIREGDADEESQLVESVDVDGVTCTMQDSWVSAPVSGDTYEVAYRLEDVATIAGCDYETDSFQWVIATKRLVVGSATLNGYFGMSHGQVLRLADRGATEEDMSVTGLGRFEIGQAVDDDAKFGAIIFYTADTDNDTVFDGANSGTLRLYEATFAAARNHEGVNSIDMDIDATVDLKFGRVNLYGVDSPKLKKVVIRAQDTSTQVYWSTKSDLASSAMWNGWLKSSIDQTIYDALQSEANTAQVRILIEG